MKKILLLFASLLFIAYTSQAQISGKVKDKQTGKFISNADVFINNSSIATKTNSDGEFALNGIAPGFAELVVYRENFVIFKSSLRIQIDKAYTLNLELSPESGQQKSKVKPDAQYKDHFQWFEKALLGGTDNATGCKIINAKAISFSKEGSELMVSFNEPLVIDNLALGYRIIGYMPDIKTNRLDVEIKGLYRYEILESKLDEQPTIWERNRLKTYWGSSRHLFESLVKGNASKEGFQLFNEAGQRIPTDTLVSEGKIKYYYQIHLSNKIKVHYTFEQGTSGVNQTGPTGQVSWIEFKGPVEVTIDGIPFNAQTLKIEGSMSEGRLAEQLPLNYAPTATLNDEQMDWQNFSLLREKVYLHTDRDYYYPRESVWFKAYMGYSMELLRDTLSRTLYVELISPDKKIVDSKVCPIKEGVAAGDFMLDQSLMAGQYFIRAYTNWMRNYGDSTFFIKVIPVLNVNENADISQVNLKNVATEQIKISTNKESYKARQNVELQVQIVDENEKPVRSNLSVSVTDIVAAVPIQSVDISHPKSLAVETMGAANKYFDQITHYMERGLSFRGVVKDSKNVPSPASLQIIQGNMDNLISMETDETGVFLVTGLYFTDSMMFAFKPVNRKGKPLEKVELLPREIPSLLNTMPALSFQIKKEDVLQRIQNTYQAEANVRMLEEVEIKSTRLATDAEKRDVKVYGTPDYVVKSDKLTGTSAGTNFLVGLQGKVPGLQVTEFMDAGGMPQIRVRIRGGTSSLTGDTEPLILVDGVPFPNAQSISAIDPSQVDRVEVVTKASPQFGSRGTNGIIAIYTKSGRIDPLPTEKNYLAFKVPGYSLTRKFYSPDYTTPSEENKNPDFRTTIYWKPDVITDEKGIASVNFYTADLATRYRIVVEGVTDQGKPLRAVSYITVE